jgi:hypothetical protein
VVIPSFTPNRHRALWMRLGDVLGYDLLPEPHPFEPRYSSEILGACYYIVWYALNILVLFLGSVLALPFRSVLGGSSIWLGVILVSLIYSWILFFLRMLYLYSRHSDETPT